jgi:hypothetical protein
MIANAMDKVNAHYSTPGVPRHEALTRKFSKIILPVAARRGKSGGEVL